MRRRSITSKQCQYSIVNEWNKFLVEKIYIWNLWPTSQASGSQLIRFKSLEHRRDGVNKELYANGEKFIFKNVYLFRNILK